MPWQRAFPLRGNFLYTHPEKGLSTVYIVISSSRLNYIRAKIIKSDLILSIRGSFFVYFVFLWKISNDDPRYKGYIENVLGI